MGTPEENLQRIVDRVNKQEEKFEVHKTTTNDFFYGPDSKLYVLTTTGNFQTSPDSKILDYVKNHLGQESQYRVFKDSHEIYSVHDPKVNLRH
jgi:hypothetical protein